MLQSQKANWIEQFENVELQYNDFYKDIVETIPITILYVNNKNHLFHIKKKQVIIGNNILKKTQLIQLLREYMYYNNIKYRPITILKWNINMEPEEVPLYLNDTTKFDFLTVEKTIDDITFDETINLFQNINGIYIVFHENWDSFNRKTKKIYITSGKQHYNKKRKNRTKSKRI